MSVLEIASMRIREIMHRNSVIGLWTPDTHLKDALWLLEVWGFTFRHQIPWAKVAKGKIQIGSGHYCRMSHETALFATRGRPKRMDAGVSSVIIAPRTPKHSEKPVNLHEKIERMYRGPRLELFARSRRRGWTGWGLECPKTLRGGQAERRRAHNPGTTGSNPVPATLAAGVSSLPGHRPRSPARGRGKSGIHQTGTEASGAIAVA
jgi:N6-adenosine-specific RNA methylase IME4